LAFQSYRRIGLDGKRVGGGGDVSPIQSDSGDKGKITKFTLPAVYANSVYAKDKCCYYNHSGNHNHRAPTPSQGHWVLIPFNGRFGGELSSGYRIRSRFSQARTYRYDVFVVVLLFVLFAIVNRTTRLAMTCGLIAKWWRLLELMVGDESIKPDKRTNNHNRSRRNSTDK